MSSSTTITVESSYHVWDDSEGVSITVGQDQDGLGVVRISNVDDAKSVEWFGKIDFTISTAIAEGLAKALVRKVRDMKENNS